MTGEKRHLQLSDDRTAVVLPDGGGGLLRQQALMSPRSTGVGAGKGSGHEGGARGKGCWWRGQHKQRQAAGQQESVPRLLSIYCSKGVQGVPPGHLCTSGRERQKADGTLKAPSSLSGNASDNKSICSFTQRTLTSGLSCARPTRMRHTQFRPEGAAV